MSSVPTSDVPAPSGGCVDPALITRYLGWLRREGQCEADDFPALWRWSVTEPDRFWCSVWDFFDVLPPRTTDTALASPAMPGARWFPGQQTSYARNALRHDEERPALICREESSSARSVTTYGELRTEVAHVAAGLRALGVEPGDRVAAVLPNRREAVVAFLATASLGAIWTLCSPEFGASSIVARLAQTEPRVLVTTDAYRFNGRVFDIRERLRQARAEMPSVETLVEVVSGLVERSVSPEVDWSDLSSKPEMREPVLVDFEHPLWILFSSGTTGIPKAMLQSHGGIVLEHLKSIGLHNDVQPGQRFFWYTSTAWMMWNYLVSGLLAGATVVLYDGAPQSEKVWPMAVEEDVALFGASPGFYQALLEQGVAESPRALHTLGSTGSRLLVDTELGLAATFGPAAKVASVSGGTDVCSAFVGPNPLMPVVAGEMQYRMLGVSCEAFDGSGRPLRGEIGELVVLQPMPSMPLAFWGDATGERLRSTYFDAFPGVWRHGDWIRFTERGGAVITGRSDATLNRGGVRMGTSEFYQTLSRVPEIADALVVDTGDLADGRSLLLLFVVLHHGVELTGELSAAIAAHLRREISPRHAPDAIVKVDDVPYTLTGKKCEVPVKRVLLGADPETVADPQSLRNPEAFTPIVESRDRLRAEGRLP